jgi:hypothetical protein
MSPMQKKCFLVTLVVSYWVAGSSFLMSQDNDRKDVVKRSIAAPGLNLNGHNPDETDAEWMQRNRRGTNWMTFAEKWGTLNFEELTEAISAYDDDFSPTFTRFSRDSTPLLNWYEFPTVVADARVGRLYRMLLDKPTQEAAIVSQKMFRQKLADVKQSAKLGMRGENWNFTLHGLFASAFFCVQFCDSETVDELLCEWIMFQRSHFNDQNKMAVHLFEHAVGPNPVGLINLYYCALLKQGMSREEIETKFNRILEPYGSKLPDVEIRRISDFDGVLIKVPVIRSTIGSPVLDYLPDNDAKQLRIAQAARELLVPPSPVQKAVRQQTESTINAAKTYLGQWNDFLSEQLGSSPSDQK